MKHKRGQITIFIIMGIVLLVVVSFLLYYESELSQRDKGIDISKLPSDVAPVKVFIDSCIKQVVEDGIVWVSLQGGYYEVMNGYNYSFISVPYYFHLGDNNFPEKNIIEKEFSKYINDNLLKCVNNFEAFREMGYEIITEDISSDTSLGKTINIEINFPITIKKGESTTKIKDFYYNQDFNFDKLYNILLDFAEEHQKNPDFVPIGYLSLLAYQNDFTYDLIYEDNKTVIYSFNLNDLFEEEKILIFNFASKYEWKEIETKDKIKINPIEPQSTYPGYEFGYQVTAKGENIEFTDYTDLFDINTNTGWINFTPSLSDRGTYHILIKSFDDKGNEDIELLQLEVITENNPPEIETIGNIEINISETFIKTVNATDPENDTLFYYLETSLSNFTINPLNGTMRFKPILGQEGDYTITLMVFDTYAEYDKTYFNVRVKS